jgi:hypothetical protein
LARRLGSAARRRQLTYPSRRLAVDDRFTEQVGVRACSAVEELDPGRAQEPVVAIATFEGSDEENAALLERVNATGEDYLSNTTLDGRYVLRLAIGHHRTTQEDVRGVWELLQSACG